jgi:hypothetical protein
MKDVEFIEYSNKFSDTYCVAMDKTLMEIKNFCVQMATAYSIIYIEDTNTIPRIKAVVYSPASDTYYVHCDDLAFVDYLMPRMKKFFLNPQFGFEKFTITYDLIDYENFVIEVHLNDESTILNNSFFKLQSKSV